MIVGYTGLTLLKTLLQLDHVMTTESIDLNKMYIRHFVS